MTVRILHGHVLDRLAELEDESVSCICTSPPYWGLRSYGTEPQLWGGNDPACEHEWGSHYKPPPGGKSAASSGLNGAQTSKKYRETLEEHHQMPGVTTHFCRHCGAWRGELGLEPDYRLYVEHIVTVFDALWRVLRSDGVAWLNLGDCYATGAGLVGKHPGGGDQGKRWAGRGVHTVNGSGKASRRIAAMGPMTQPNRMPQRGLKPKDLVGVPWRVAFALQDRGWWLRKDNIVHKRNPMPESVVDRTTTAHEYVFQLTKAEKYWYDADAIAEPSSPDSHARAKRGRSDAHKWADGGHGNQTIAKKSPSAGKIRASGVTPKSAEPGSGIKQNASFNEALVNLVPERNRRSVWMVNTSPTPEAHFATMPETVAEICILAGCPIGGTVLDPFLGSGTTARVADRLARDCIGIDLQPNYIKMAERRTREPGLALQF